MSDYDREQPDAPDPLVNIEAEGALLGAMMIDNRFVTDWADRLKPEDFVEPLHQRVFNALLRFSAKGRTATAIAMKPIFALDPDANGGDYLARLVDSSAATVGANDFAEQIIDLSDRRVARDAIRAAAEMIDGDLDAPILEITGRVEAAGWSASTRTTATRPRSVYDMVGLAEERVRRVQDEGEPVGMENKLVPDLDRILGPLEVGYHILAGRPGMGKTTLALSAALGYAINDNPGVYLSGEMTDEQLALRMVTDLAFALGHKIKHDSLRRGTLTTPERQILGKVGSRGSLIPLDFVDLRGANIRRVWGEVARRKAFWAAQGKKLKFAVLDSIGLFAADIDGKAIEDDRKRINFISTFINQMAHALDIAVIVLSQLSRGVEGRQVKKPVLSDLKETGNLEQDADSVTFIYREEYYLESSEPKRGEKDVRGADLHEEWEVAMNIARGKADLIGAKNRHGRNMSRTVRFYGETYSIRETAVVDDGIDEPLLV